MRPIQVPEMLFESSRSLFANCLIPQPALFVVLWPLVRGLIAVAYCLGHVDGGKGATICTPRSLESLIGQGGGDG